LEENIGFEILDKDLNFWFEEFKMSKDERMVYIEKEFKQNCEEVCLKNTFLIF
jgi:hypothetical protein